MNEDEVIRTVNELSKSDRFYVRFALALEQMRVLYPAEYGLFITDAEKCKDATELKRIVEG